MAKLDCALRVSGLLVPKYGGYYRFHHTILNCKIGDSSSFLIFFNNLFFLFIGCHFILIFKLIFTIYKLLWYHCKFLNGKPNTEHGRMLLFSQQWRDNWWQHGGRGHPLFTTTGGEAGAQDIFFKYQVEPFCIQVLKSLTSKMLEH